MKQLSPEMVIPELKSQIAIGLGGNIGDPKAAMREALANISANSDVKILSLSPLYQTPPWGVLDQPPFMNACALLKTSLTPHEVLELCLETELGLGRKRKERWGPRTIDLDVLFYDDVIMKTDKLTLPHPRICERAFVLVPLAQICPDKIIEGKSVMKWSQSIDQQGITIADGAEDWWI